MQLLDKTAIETAEKIGLEFDVTDIYDSELNIMLGTKYLANLIKEYNGDIDLALAAYNAGKGNVKTWIDNETITVDNFNIDDIPFKETKNYIKKVNENYKGYKKLYIE